MEPEKQKVTSEKPKNPGRVEWGRKLGKMSKQKKDEKEKEKEVIVSEQKLPATDNKWYFIAGSAILAGSVIFYLRRNNEPRIIKSNEIEQPKMKSFVNF